MQQHWILTLPEIRELIARHLDAETRQEAVLVSRAFYETICSIEWNNSLVLDEKVS